MDLTGVTGAVTAPVVQRLGYFESKRIEYYDFGDVKTSSTVVTDAQGQPVTLTVAATNPMYWFEDAGGRPLARLALDQGVPVLDADFLAALAEPAEPRCIGTDVPTRPGATCNPSLVQHPIVDTVFGKTNYTPFWRIVKVTAPAGYELDSIKSLNTLKAANFRMQETGLVVNCPFIDVTATLKAGASARDRLYVRLFTWYRGQLGTCVLVEGANHEVLKLVSGSAATSQPPFPTDIYLVGTDMIPALTWIRNYVPTYPAGSTTALATPVPNNLIAPFFPGDPMYAPFVRIYTPRVPSSYPMAGMMGSCAGITTWRSVADVMACLPADQAMSQGATTNYRNYPVRGQNPTCMTTANCPMFTACSGGVCQVPACTAASAAMVCTPIGAKCNTVSGFCEVPR